MAACFSELLTHNILLVKKKRCDLLYINIVYIYMYKINAKFELSCEKVELKNLEPVHTPAHILNLKLN